MIIGCISRIRDWITDTKLVQKFVIFLLSSVVSRIIDLSFKDWKTSFWIEKNIASKLPVIFRLLRIILKSLYFRFKFI